VSVGVRALDAERIHDATPSSPITAADTVITRSIVRRRDAVSPRLRVVRRVRCCRHPDG
jgi:hypothetical protein